MKTRPTDGPYRPGKQKYVVVSDASNGLTVNGATGERSVDYYGGNLIAESVSPCNVPLLAASWDLLRLLRNLANRDRRMVEAGLSPSYTELEEAEGFLAAFDGEDVSSAMTKEAHHGGQEQN